MKFLKLLITRILTAVYIVILTLLYIVELTVNMCLFVPVYLLTGNQIEPGQITMSIREATSQWKWIE